MEDRTDPGGSLAPSLVTEAPPAPAAPGPPVKARGRRLLIAGAIAIALLIVVGAIAAIANNALSQTYSARQAVLDYFAAQQRGNVNAMWANATYVRSEGAYSEYFGKPAVAAMMNLVANSDIHGVSVTSVSMVDSNTAMVGVSMTWQGTALNQRFTVRADSSQVHWLFYHSWRIEIPSSTIQLTLPNQAGPISVDGIITPIGSSATNIGVIMGFHRVSMSSTGLYDSYLSDVDALGTTGNGTLKGTVSQAAVDAAGATIKDTFANHCDVSKYYACFNHTYNAPNQDYIWVMAVPGYGDLDYMNYSYTLTGDPTAGMTLTVQAEANKVAVSGSCTSTLNIDGTRHYNLKGTWSGTLTWNGSSFGSDLSWDCNSAKA